jgi:hypothetical protein
MHNDLKFIRHDRHNEKAREISAAAVRKALGDFFFDRLVARAAAGRNYAVEAHGFVFEAVRIN